MKHVTSTQANRDFSKLLKSVEQGQTVQISSRGRPVAVLAPVKAQTAERQAAVRRLLDHLHRQPIADVARDWQRDDLYD